MDIMENNPFYEITTAYPEIHKYFGLLAGFAFSISYSISGIFMGIISSKVNRKNLFCLMFTVSCLTSIFTGYFDSFAVLVAMRII
jgi:sugar phosphate permease